MVQDPLPLHASLKAGLGDGLSEEGNMTLSMLPDQLNIIINTLDALEAQIEKYEQENNLLKQKLSKIEERIDSLESDSRVRNLVLSGKADSNASQSENPLDTVLHLFKQNLQCELPANSIGNKPPNQSPDKRSLMVKLHNYESKRYIQAACRTVKPSDFFANDDLIPVRSSMLYALR